MNIDGSIISSDTWSVQFKIIRPLKSFPRPHTVSKWRAADAEYRCPGRYRTGSPHCVFQYTLSGYGILRVGSKTHRISAGTGFLCDTSEAQICYYYPETSSVPWDFIYVTFRGAEDMVNSMISRLGYIYKMGIDSPLIERLMQFKSHVGTYCDISASDGSVFVATILSDLCKTHSSRLDSSPQGVILKKAFQYIHGNMDQPINVTGLACELGITPQHLIRVFREELETSPALFINESKINRACELLSSSEMSINNIGEAVGMPGPSHFARTFKRMKGISPRDFRKKRF